MNWLYPITSVIIVSLISLIGILVIILGKDRMYKKLIFLVSFSAGTLLGDAFIHLIPEAYDTAGNKITISLYLLSGILLFFILEKIVHWRHCHEEPCETHPHPFSYVILVGDSVHNFIDGLIIGASYLVSIPVGIATTIAVIFHEIPQEIGDFGSLIYGGFSRLKALVYNFISALFAVLGALLVLFFGNSSGNLVNFLIPFAAGGFIYIASSDLIPELHKSTEIKKSIWQVITFVFGVILMLLLLIID
jgi:zinc and cadmium transporter